MIDAASWRADLDAIPEPEEPWVRPDPWSVLPDRNQTCMNLGPVLVGTTGAPRHTPVPCHAHDCSLCGPLRAAIIRANMIEHLRPTAPVWFYVWRGRPGKVLPTRTITQRVQSKEGSYLWLRFDGEDGVQILAVLSDVDHSVSGRGGPARDCVELMRSEALTVLDFLLWHGIAKRQSSRDWKLTDGEREHRGTSKSVHVGVLGAFKAARVEPTSRDLHAADQLAALVDGRALPDWPEWADSVTGFTQSKMVGLHDRSVTKLLARNQATNPPGPFD